MDIRQQLLAAFEVEHREHLDAIRAALSAGAASEPTDWTDVFRRAHSLKGAARAVDLPAVEAVAHRMETLFERIRAGRSAPDRDVLAATHLALDRIEAYVAALKGGTAVMPDDALTALDGCLRPDAPAAPARNESGGAPVRAPDIAAPDPSAASDPPPESGPAFLRVPAAAVEAVARAAHGLAGVLPRETAVAEGIARITTAAAELRRQTSSARATGSSPSKGLSDRLGQIEAGLASLARDAAELARAQKAFAASLETASARLREETERLALAPAESVFGGFARAIREMARSEGREVEITVRGLDLPLDRGMLQILKDPVLHALRNALSHGTESPERRRMAGKPPALAILFELDLRGGQLVLGIHDDGRGPDLPMIEARARERGLLADGESVDADRLLSLAFEPGLSTSAAIDTLSGRGIGLSVVADAARRLNGGVRLEQRRPHGTSLVMTLPLAAAQRPVLLVEAGDGTYALPGTAVERLLRLDGGARGSVMGRSVARISEGSATVTLPLADLAELLGGVPGPEREPASPAILLRSGAGRCILTVDRLHDVRTLLILPPPAAAVGGLVSGTAILASGRPALVLDAESLAARTGERTETPPPPGPKAPGSAVGMKPTARRATILVVDDSITTRTLEKSILEAAGYRVVVCVDGQDALDRLRSGIEPVDVVVADIEMPRLDGFGLVAALRGDEAFSKLPIILMTSRGASEDVARGLQLGADAYLTKQTFDQRELLDTIGQLL